MCFFDQDGGKYSSGQYRPIQNQLFVYDNDFYDSFCFCKSLQKKIQVILGLIEKDLTGNVYGNSF